MHLIPLINILQTKTTSDHATQKFFFVQKSTAFRCAKKEQHGKGKDSTNQPNRGKSSHLSLHFKIEAIAASKFMNIQTIPSKENSESLNLEQKKKSSGILGACKNLTKNALERTYILPNVCVCT